MVETDLFCFVALVDQQQCHHISRHPCISSKESMEQML